jgi:hypothetical protein
VRAVVLFDRVGDANIDPDECEQRTLSKIQRLLLSIIDIEAADSGIDLAAIAGRPELAAHRPAI